MSEKGGNRKKEIKSKSRQTKIQLAVDVETKVLTSDVGAVRYLAYHI